MIPREDGFWEVVFDEPNGAHSWADSCPLRGRTFGGLRILFHGRIGKSKPFSLIFLLSFA